MLRFEMPVLELFINATWYYYVGAVRATFESQHRLVSWLNLQL
jgi:hypothetical protein